MPDFVKENALNEDEKRQQEEHELELSKAHLSSVQESERKSLYEQLQDAKAKKQEKFDQMIASRNSSYKLDEKSAQFLESVRQEKLRKEEAKILHEASELQRFKAMKEKKIEVEEVDIHKPLVLKKRKLTIPKIATSKALSVDSVVIKDDKKKEAVAETSFALPVPHDGPILGLGSYSSDESEESN